MIKRNRHRRTNASRKHASDMNRYYRDVNKSVSRMLRKIGKLAKRAAKHARTR
jgi:hypothetical protein